MQETRRLAGAPVIQSGFATSGATIGGGNRRPICGHSRRRQEHRHQLRFRHRRSASQNNSYRRVRLGHSTDADFASTTYDQFAVRAQNGVMVGNNTVLDFAVAMARFRVAGAGVASNGPVFIHRATVGQHRGHIAIDNPLANGASAIRLTVTHNFSADTSVTDYRPTLSVSGMMAAGGRFTTKFTGIAMPVGGRLT